MYFEALYPDVGDTVQAVWAAGNCASRGGDFNTYVKQCDLSKQEGIIFRHLLRLILLCAEFGELTPPDTTQDEWKAWLRELEAKLTAACRKVDPTSTDLVIQSAKAADVVEGEEAKPLDLPPPPPEVELIYSAETAQQPVAGFGEGLLDDSNTPEGPSSTG